MSCASALKNCLLAPRASISRAALRHNFRVLKDASGGTPICAMIKADAYGHGMDIVVEALSGMDVAFWGIATPNEALRLRKLNPHRPILLFMPIEACGSMRRASEMACAMIRAGVRPTVESLDGVLMLENLASRARAVARAHLRVDTGMSPNGCYAEEAEEALKALRACRHVKLEGVYSHFASSDAEKLDFARIQFRRFAELLDKLAERGARIPLRHIANSGAIFNLPETRLDMVRPGISLYGYAGKNTRGSGSLRPALRLEAPIIMTRWIAAGDYCGYDRTFRAKRPTRAGMVPVGYADGYDRRLSNRGVVAFGARRLPVIGRVSMDMICIDLTDAPEAVRGKSVCVISDKKEDPNSVESMARELNTIPHEITCSIGPRVERSGIE